jgi:hypothetical protein
MIKFIKKIWNKLFGKKEEVIKLVVEAPVIQKPTHCPYHKKFKKSCTSCQTIAAGKA